MHVSMYLFIHSFIYLFIYYVSIYCIYNTMQHVNKKNPGVSTTAVLQSPLSVCDWLPLLSQLPIRATQKIAGETVLLIHLFRQTI